MKKHSIRNNLVRNTLLISASMIIIIMLVALFNLNKMGNTLLQQRERLLRNDFDLLIQGQVESVLSILDTFHNRVTAGELSMEEAKKSAADLIREMRFGTDGYFWADTANGDNVVLLGRDTEGTNRLNAQDNNGVRYIQEFIKQGKKAEGGFTDYYFSKADNPDLPLPKRGYTKYFEPFDWIVGTGNYVDDIDAVVESTKMEIHGSNSATVVQLILIGGIMLILAALLSILFANRIVKPIHRLVDVAENVSRGNLHTPPMETSQDEIGVLAQAFEKMVGDIREQIGIVERLADGDLTADVHPRSAEDTMGIALKEMCRNLNNMFGEIDNSARHVSTGAGQIADAAQTLAQGAVEQSATMERLEISIAEVAEKTKNNVGMAQQAATLASTIKNNAEKGSQQMSRMMQAVKEINEASQLINKVIKVIDDIAFQTNILALNAAVEAARAGQHGKGFAVVADEVRNLASKSAEAAKDTSALIVNSMEKAELGAQIANETALSLDDIVSGINESSRIMGEIAHFSEAQSAAIDIINGELEQVAQVVQQNSATAEESAASSEELSNQSNMLQGLVTRFRLKETPVNHRQPPPALPSVARRPVNLDGDFGKY